jgi:Yip1-like protein
MNLIDRARNILLQPKLEWPVIAAEPADVRIIYTRYVMILAAIPAVMTILRAILFSAAFGSFAASVSFAVVAAAIGYVLTLVMVYLVALIADAVAPGMGGEKNFMQSLKLVAYSMTASWVGAVFTIVPILGWLIALLAGFYGIYIFYSGVAVMKKIPDAKSAAYTAIVVIGAILVGWLVGAIVSAFTGTGMMGPRGMGHY